MIPARPVRFEDLPKATRSRVAGRLDRPKTGRTPPAALKEVTARPAPAPPRDADCPRWRCHRCGQEFTAWAPAEAHGRAGHHRLELILP